MKISGTSWPYKTSVPSRANEAKGGRETKENTESKENTETALEKSLKNLRTLSNGLKNLRAASSSKRRASSKLGFLKQRLETMKAVIPFVAPAQAKELLRELKSIAKEMASIARSLRGDGGTDVSLNLPDLGALTAAGEDSAATGADAADAAADAGEQGSMSESEAASAANEAAAAAEGEAANAPKESEGPRSAESGSRYAVSQGAPDASDKDIRTLLEEMGRMVKHILALLKTRLSDHESEKGMAAVEKELKTMEKALAQSADFYDIQGASVSAETQATGIDVNA